MAQPPSDEKKMDISSLPRGAIGIKGLPISRNTRLPSIRSPRDLTLGAPPKRTFMPNIPPRREKKSALSEGKTTPRTDEKAIRPESKNASNSKGRGRGKPNIIQTQGSVFSEGIAENALSRKERISESYQKSDYAVMPKSGISLKREQLGDKGVAGISKKMNDLFRDDFIDDDTDDDAAQCKPTIFPPEFLTMKEETQSEAVEQKIPPKPVVKFDSDIAKAVGFDVNRVAEFIKKEKETEIEEKPKPAEKQKPFVSTEVPQNKIVNMLNAEVPQLVLLQFPTQVSVSQKLDDSQQDQNSRGHSVANSTTLDDKKASPPSIASFPDGCVGKLQVLKSGRTRLILGNLNFELDSVSPLRTKHEVVAIRTSSDGGELSVLDYVERKLKFVPDVDSYL